MTRLLVKLFLARPQDTHDPSVRTAYGKLASWVGICCNLALCLAKVLAGLCFGAVSIVADGFNNLSDASGGLITLLGFRVSARPADSKHPYGYARVEYLSALGVAVLILVLGVELAINSVQEILSYFTSAPGPCVPQHLALVSAVLFISILVKLWLTCFYRALGRRIQSAALSASGTDSLADVVSTSAVLAAYLLEAATGWRLDAWMGLAVACFILWSGVRLVKDTVSPLLGEAVDPALADQIRQEICKHDMILGVHDLIVHDYGPGRQFASVHVEIDRRQSVQAAHDLIDQIEEAFRREHHISLVIHYDPIATDDPERNQLTQQLLHALAAIDPRLGIHDLRLLRDQQPTEVHFDLELPFSLREREQAIVALLRQVIAFQNPDYCVRITTDFVP